MTNLAKNIKITPGPAPSAKLLDQFAQHADRLRLEAGDCKVTASAAAEAGKNAHDAAAEMTAAYRALAAEVDRARRAFDDLSAQLEAARKAFDEKTAEADQHRHRADEHERRAAELLNDAAYLDETVARAPQRFPILGPQCSCVLPGAPDAAERAAACPVHSTAAAQNGDGGGRADP